MWIAVIIIAAILFFIIGGVVYMVWERRLDARLPPKPEPPPDGGS